MNLLNLLIMTKLFYFLSVLLICSCSKTITIKNIQQEEISYENVAVTVNGIVSGVYQNKGELAGFFMQYDALFSTNGIFVHTKKKVNLGDEISIMATVVEYKNETRLDSVKSIEILSVGNSYKTQKIKFPYTLSDIENLEGCLIRIDNDLQISDSYSFEKYGQILVSSKPLIQATEIYDAQNEAAEISEHNLIQAQNSIVLDDLSNKRFPLSDGLYLDKDGVVLGANISGVTGYVCQRNNNYSIRLVNDLEFDLPELNLNTEVDGLLKIMSFNLHNLFNGNGIGGKFPTPRGAKTYEAYQKQLSKLASAISFANPDVIAVMEIENDGEDSLSTIFQFCEYLNSHSNRSNYKVAYTSGKAAKDVIKTCIIYDSSVLSTKELGKYHSNTIFSRNPLFQEFVFQDSLSFVLSVNHFKSKSPRGAKDANEDQNDGQSAYNAKRVLQAEALIEIIDSLYFNKNLIVLGDFNAYSKEDPVQYMQNHHLVKLSTNQYTYVYKGMQGDLDHAFVSQPFKSSVNETKVLNINASFPNWIDYRFENSDISYFRSSDHNPLLIGVY